jgi:hypothetical protein
VVAAVAAAASFTCHAQGGLGRIALARRGKLHVIEMRNCRDRVVGRSGQGQVQFAPSGRVRVVPFGRPLVSGDGRWRATVRATGKRETLRNTIWVTNTRTGKTHPVYSTRVWGNTTDLRSPGPIELLGWSGDDRWVFFAIDPGASGSLAADGLILRVISATGGKPHRIAVMLMYRDYFTWCGGRLVFSGGPDRVAAHGKALLVASPPSWKPAPLVRSPGRSWGSLACRPDGRSLVAQSQTSSTDANFFHTHWALWQVGLDGSRLQLTRPPSGYADESPRFSRDGRRLLFGRSREGRGKLYLLHGRALTGPLLSLGYSLGYYGHQDWWQSMDWSLAAASR